MIVWDEHWIDSLGKFPCQMGVSACVLITSAALTVVLLTQLGPICERDRVCAGCEQKAAHSLSHNTHTSGRERRSGCCCSENLCARLNKLTLERASWFSRCSKSAGRTDGDGHPQLVVYPAHYRPCFQLLLLFAERRYGGGGGCRFPLCMLDFHYLSLLAPSSSSCCLPWVICIVKSSCAGSNVLYLVARADGRPAPRHRC